MKKTNLLVGLFCIAGLSSCQKEKSKPNIIYILMDDMGYGDLQCYGQQKIETPNIDRLRNNGIKLTQHYTGSPVSAPARCVLLTGLHSGHTQIRANDEIASRGAINSHDSMYVHPELEGQYPLKSGTMTIGRMMQNAGYTTGCFGKWGLGYPGSEGVPGKQGFDQFYGYNCQRQAHNYYPPFLWKNDQRVYLDNKIRDPHLTKLDEGADPYDEASYRKFTQNEYANDLIFDEMIHFVDQNKEQPFFLLWTTPLPHVSLQAPERWVNYYVDKFGDEEPYTGNKGYMPCRYPHATYAAMISYFDEQVGKLVDKLKQEGLYEKYPDHFHFRQRTDVQRRQRLPLVQQRRIIQIGIRMGEMFRPRRRNTRTGYRLLAWKDQSRNRIRPYLCISGCNADTGRYRFHRMSSNRRNQFPAGTTRRKRQTETACISLLGIS